MTPYESYLRSEGWKQKRWTVIMLWKSHCARCGNIFQPEELEVHHAQYDIDLRMVPIEELRPLCKKCHDKVYEPECLKTVTTLPRDPRASDFTKVVLYV
jgi:5-methylcytosine-specific restriction endonuclease McrA